MPRKNRVIYEGAIYHVYQRGNNKDFIFQDDKVKRFMLKCLIQYNKKFDYEILAYVIMNNHYHLLIRTNEASISEIMFYINNLLAKYVNNLLNRTGHVFENRYKCKLVETDGYLIWLLRYIHRNPVKAGICSNVDQYKWSSHYYYKHPINSNINSKFVLSMFGDNRKEALKRYLKLVNAVGDNEDMNRDYEIIEGIIKSYPLVSVLGEITAENSFSKPCRKTMQQILDSMRISDDILDNIRKGKRGRKYTPIKRQIAKKAVEECYTMKEVSECLNVVPSAISKLLSRG